MNVSVFGWYLRVGSRTIAVSRPSARIAFCPPTGTVGGTAYAFCGGEWWSYDTPETIAGKMDYVRSNGLAGAFFWELTGDSADGALVSAIDSGLN